MSPAQAAIRTHVLLKGLRVGTASVKATAAEFQSTHSSHYLRDPHQISGSCKGTLAFEAGVPLEIYQPWKQCTAL